MRDSKLGIGPLALVEQDPLQSVLQAYYAWNRAYAALNTEQKAEFCRQIASDSVNVPDNDITSGAGIFKDDPYWEEFNQILKGFRETGEND